jgi:uncharacterized protein YigE (DUF2233 family)
MRVLLALLALGFPGAAWAVTCQDRIFEAASYTVCDVQADEDLRLYLDGQGGPFANFASLEDRLNADNKTLAFAMNAGMFDENLAPIGLYVEAGIEGKAIVTKGGPGNFGLLPNGVFCTARAGVAGPSFQILESRAFVAMAPACWMATQSGPMLVIDGDLHPKFLKSSQSLKFRNGVGVSDDGSRAIFAISNDAVNFHSFARLFRDELGLNQALFLDGSISRLYAPQMERSDLGFPIGPIVAVVEQKE